MGIGATSVVYMLGHGISLGDIALIKIFQAVAIFFFEIPTGFVADVYGRKSSVLLACLMGVLSFLCFVAIPNFGGFCVAEIFNALAISFWSGAFEALAVDNNHSKTKEKNFLEFFFAKTSKYTNLAILLAGTIGGYVAEFNPEYPFYFSLALMGLAWVYIKVGIEDQHFTLKDGESTLLVKRLTDFKKNLGRTAGNTLDFVVNNSDVKKFFIIQACLQFALQPVFHYWQPYFKSIQSTITEADLGNIFFLYVLAKVIITWVAALAYKRNWFNMHSFNWFTLTVSFLSFSLLGVSASLWFSIVLFCLVNAMINLFRSNLMAEFNKGIPSSERGVILSSVSFISRLGMFLHLIILSYSAVHFPIGYSFLGSSVSLVLLAYYFFLLNASKKKLSLAGV